MPRCATLKPSYPKRPMFVLVREYLPDGSSCLFLWPERLRWHIWLLGIMFTAFYATQTPCAIPICAWTLALLFLFVISPWLLYYLGRKPVLHELIEPGEPTYDDHWWRQVTSYELRGDGLQRAKSLVPMILPPLTGAVPRMLLSWRWIRWLRRRLSSADALSWAPAGSPMKTLLRLALVSHYRVTEDSPAAIWTDPVLRRWILHWCLPVMLSLFAVLATVLLDVSCAPPCQIHGCLEPPVPARSPSGDVTLHLMIWVWMFYALYYIRTQFVEFEKSCEIDPVKDSRMLTISLKPAVPRLAQALTVLSDVRVQLISGGIAFLAGTILIGLVTAIHS